MNFEASIGLNDIAAAWSSWMLGMAWIVAILVVILSLVTAVLKGRSASLLYTLWLLVLIRLMLPPGFAFPTGWGWWVRGAPTDVVSDLDPATSAAGGPPAAPEVQSRPGGTVPPQASDSASLPVAMILMIAWLGIVAARCGMLFTAALQVHVWVSRARLILDPALLDLLENCRTRVGVRRKVELRNSEACSTPLVVGAWRPVLLLPAPVLDRLNSEQLQAVLIHELHHVRRWDGLMNLLQGLLGAVYFFHPAVWWANRRIRQLREDACDERTVAVLDGNRKPYGEAIFRVAEILGYSAPPLTLGVLDSTSPLTQRLRRILDPRLPVDGGRRWQSALIVLLATAILLPAGARPAASDANEPNERRIVAEALSESPLGTVKKYRITPPRVTTGPAEESPLPETVPDATPDLPPAPSQLRQDSTSNRRSVEDLVNDLAIASRREAAADALAEMGPVAEFALLAALPDADPTTRTAIYGILARVGTQKSLLPLHQTLLRGDDREENQIRLALDAIYGRMEIPISDREPSADSSRSSRIYEADTQWNDGF